MHFIDNISEFNIRNDNNKIFYRVGQYLNNNPKLITEGEIKEMLNVGVSAEYAFTSLLSSYFQLDIINNSEDKDLFYDYLINMVEKLDMKTYQKNPYYKNIKFTEQKIGNCEFKMGKYQAYEGFVCNDIVKLKNGRQIPQLGFFETEFLYPAIFENDRLWMSVTPNEINTMKEPIERAFGNVLTFGLGLGYYAYMVSEKNNVESVTIIENNDNIINLFKEYILPQFKNVQKINIIKTDAFEYAESFLSGSKYDFVFVDLWHDVSDGIEMYLKMKEYEIQNSNIEFTYWIEKSIKCYL